METPCCSPKNRLICILTALILIVIFTAAGFLLGRNLPTPSANPIPAIPTTAACGSCPQFSPPSPNFCQDGTIVPGAINECGCQSSPTCVKIPQDWKTYTNTKYKYSLKYPSPWQVSASDNLDPNTFYEARFSSPCDYNQNRPRCMEFLVLVATYIPEENFYDYEPEIDPGGKSNQVSLKLDKEDATGFEYRQDGRLQYIIIALHSNKKYIIMYEEKIWDKEEFTSTNDWENKAILDQVLSTFKFLD